MYSPRPKEETCHLDLQTNIPIMKLMLSGLSSKLRLPQMRDG